MEGTLTTYYKPNAPELYLDWMEKELGECHKVNIVGERFQPTAVPIFFEESLLLVPDHSNPVDPQAIKVLYRGAQVGWVPRNQTYLFQENLRPNVKDIKVISGPLHCLYVIVYGR